MTMVAFGDLSFLLFVLFGMCHKACEYEEKADILQTFDVSYVLNPVSLYGAEYYPLKFALSCVTYSVAFTFFYVIYYFTTAYIERLSRHINDNKLVVDEDGVPHEKKVEDCEIMMMIQSTDVTDHVSLESSKTLTMKFSASMFLELILAYSIASNLTYRAVGSVSVFGREKRTRGNPMTVLGAAIIMKIAYTTVLFTALYHTFERPTSYKNVYFKLYYLVYSIGWFVLKYCYEIENYIFEGGNRDVLYKEGRFRLEGWASIVKALLLLSPIYGYLALHPFKVSSYLGFGGRTDVDSDLSVMFGWMCNRTLFAYVRSLLGDIAKILDSGLPVGAFKVLGDGIAKYLELMRF